LSVSKNVTLYIFMKSYSNGYKIYIFSLFWNSFWLSLCSRENTIGNGNSENLYFSVQKVSGSFYTYIYILVSIRRDVVKSYKVIGHFQKSYDGRNGHVPSMEYDQIVDEKIFLFCLVGYSDVNSVIIMLTIMKVN